MKTLQQRIEQASHDPGRGVIRVDSFLNHQVDPNLMREIGNEFARLLSPVQPTKILTVETGGIAPALATAMAMNLPLIIARKRRAAGMPRELLQESTLSQTRHEAIDLFVAPEFLGPQDRVILIDDFLTNAQVLLALARLARSGGAEVVGVGTVIEKALEGGRSALDELNVPVVAAVRIGKISSAGIQFLD